ncbi:hypothetical protein BDV98DRAFT_563944 [Pterulicium gracile]|uniref:Uncharacterized protein n=1 Tax=Pterulicium gracile TaxID=1884261 RepID=A0A5C3QR19_9AGAR|nr:hypothetical protein BDV98DRAFT_563944 [Pterula gracilis]
MGLQSTIPVRASLSTEAWRAESPKPPLSGANPTIAPAILASPGAPPRKFLSTLSPSVTAVVFPNMKTIVPGQ